MDQILQINLITKQKKRIYKIPSAKGEIIINDFYEWFYMPLQDWNVNDYIKQWHEALDRLDTHDSSCIITGILQSKKKYVQWWLLYKIDGVIKIHNQVLFKNYYQECFGNKTITNENCYNFIPTYNPLTMFGAKKSEWILQLPAILSANPESFDNKVLFTKKYKRTWSL
jgi:hypothetical protein